MASVLYEVLGSSVTPAATVAHPINLELLANGFGGTSQRY